MTNESTQNEEMAPAAEVSETSSEQSGPAPVDSPEIASPDAVAPGDQVEEELSFAEMLAEQEKDGEKQTRLSPGQRVTVHIVAITNDTVFVSTGSKVDGIVDREELEVDGELPYAVGDTVDLYVVTVSPQEVKLSKIVRGAGSLSVLEDAKAAALPVEGKVIGQVKGGYAVEIMKRRAFCPVSQIDLRPQEDLEAVVGKTFPFLITRLEQNGRNIVVSRRALLEIEQAEHRDAVLSSISIGDTLEVTVSRLAPFGAFAEIAPGVEGLIHLSELGWSRVSQADEAVSVGDRVRAKVLSIDNNEKGARISLSIKQVTEDPWKDVPSRLTSGDVVSGKVIRTTPFGAFVEILPGIEGLVHISELSYERRVTKTEDIVVAGDSVSVKIKEIDPLKKRISLSLRDAAGDPWATVADTFAIDSDVTGTVEKRAQFGIFITLAPGITGLLPNSVAQHSSAKKELERLAPGDAVTVRIKEIDTTARRISLAPAVDDDANPAEEKDWKRHASKAAAPKTPSMGALGMALQAAMHKKNK